MPPSLYLLFRYYPSSPPSSCRLHDNKVLNYRGPIHQRFSLVSRTATHHIPNAALRRRRRREYVLDTEAGQRACRAVARAGRGADFACCYIQVECCARENLIGSFRLGIRD